MNPWPGSHAVLLKARRAFSRTFQQPFAAIGLLAAASVVGVACFNQVLVTSLPARSEIHRVAAMPQATTLLDANDQRAFTIYREQRIDVPLVARVAASGPRHRGHRGPALLRPQRHRPGPRGRSGDQQPSARQPGTGGQHADSAVGAEEFPDPREDLHAQAQGARPRPAHRGGIHQGRDPGAVPQQGVLRRRPVRRRSGVAGLLRQAGGRPRPGRGGAAGRLGEVAVHLRADRRPRARHRAPKRRAHGHARLRRHHARRAQEGGARGRRARGLAPAGRGVRSVLQGRRPPRAGRAVRPGARVPRRPRGVHDARSGDAEGR